MQCKFLLFKNEVKYMFKSKSIILLILATYIALVMGINSINMTNDFDLFYIRRTPSVISFSSAKFGATIASILFSLFTVLTLDKDRRKRSKTIVESNIDYLDIIKTRIISIVFYAIVTTIIGMLIVMSIQKIVYGIPTEISPYIFSYFMVFFPTLLFSILIIAGFYLMTESIDIGIITFGIIFIKSLTSNNYLFTWIDTNIDIISDFSGIGPVSQSVIYNRILWLFISLAILSIGLLFRRRYGFGASSSFLVNIKNKGILILVILTVLGSGFAYAKEPYTMDLIKNFNISIDRDIYLEGIHPEVDFDSENSEMSACVSYDFLNRGSNTIKFNVNEGLKIKSIKVNGEEIEYKKIKDENIIELAIPNTERVNIVISYEGRVKYEKNGVGRSMPGYISKESIYLLEVSNWIFRPLVEEGNIIDISGYYTAPDHLTMVTPGRLIDVEEVNGRKKWIFEYRSHTFDIGAFGSDYKKSEIQIENMIIEFYYTTRHEEYVKNMKIQEHIENMAKYYIENIGEYYSREYPLKIAEVPLYKRGGHSSENVITFSENAINRDNSMYSIFDKNGEIEDFRKVDIYANDINLIAHEMAHQWWGTGVNVIEDTPWSSEGLANYFSYKYIQREFGDIPSNVFLMAWERRVDELKNYYYIKNDDMKERLNKDFIRSLEMEKRQSELYYLMPLKLLKGEEIQGERVFLEGIQRVYRDHLLKNLTYHEFLKEMNLTEEALEIE
ncbi:MAG: M1 family aminopeptidase [Tissierellaceae bacterium]